MEQANDLLEMLLPTDWLFSVMPQGASTHAADIDFLYWFLIITCGVLFLLVVIPLFFIVVRYRRKKFEQRALSQTDHNFWLESMWTFLPFIYLAVLFVWGFYQYLDMYVAPHNAKELRVIGQKWQWSVDYPLEEISVAGVGATITIPVDTPIKLVMASQDVIHSFFVPNLRVKQDVVPGRYSTLWFTADKTGEFPVLCAEYCGDSHSLMLAKLNVVDRNRYDTWVEEQKAQDQALPPVELGKKLYTKLGCVACHSTDGSIKLAPSFKDVYGKSETLTDGSVVVINDNYISEKILNPTAKPPKQGFPPIMPTFQGRVEQKGIEGLIAFIKSLSQSGAGEMEK